MVLAGVRCEPGDEVIRARAEHPGGLYPVYLMKQRYCHARPHARHRLEAA